jgi:hypothetical protein
MKAIVCPKYSSPDVLRLGNVAKPVPLGKTWAFYVFFGIVEIVLTFLIIGMRGNDVAGPRQ